MAAIKVDLAPPRHFLAKKICTPVNCPQPGRVVLRLLSSVASTHSMSVSCDWINNRKGSRHACTVIFRSRAKGVEPSSLRVPEYCLISNLFHRELNPGSNSSKVLITANLNTRATQPVTNKSGFPIYKHIIHYFMMSVTNLYI